MAAMPVAAAAAAAAAAAVIARVVIAKAVVIALEVIVATAAAAAAVVGVALKMAVATPAPAPAPAPVPVPVPVLKLTCRVRNKGRDKGWGRTLKTKAEVGGTRRATSFNPSILHTKPTPIPTPTPMHTRTGMGMGMDMGRLAADARAHLPGAAAAAAVPVTSSCSTLWRASVTREMGSLTAMAWGQWLVTGGRLSSTTSLPHQQHQRSPRRGPCLSRLPRLPPLRWRRQRLQQQSVLMRGEWWVCKGRWACRGLRLLSLPMSLLPPLLLLLLLLLLCPLMMGLVMQTRLRLWQRHLLRSPTSLLQPWLPLRLQ